MAEPGTSASAVNAPEPKSAYLSPHEVILGTSSPPRPTPPDAEQPKVEHTSAGTTWKVGYDTRHLLPSFVLGVVASLSAVVLLVWLNTRLPPALTPFTLTIFWASLAALWSFLLFLWAYRGLFWRVEVTPQEVVYQRGWLWPPCSVPLTDLARIEVRQPWWQRLLGFGQVALLRESPGAEAIILVGIAQPHLLAEQITQRLHLARRHQISEHRMAFSEAVQTRAS
ncbi:MAG: PH domain-containing protein [Gemmatales bacterium]|nr:PH domain-containing protein [Gemmatales bacterium]MCS7160214.1 PH domain-containing protein [Gemmatales bacterium]MDW8175414.1 PH domain-containing protein [Gemmatales bacterium]MDW8222087.1 PH domain-containing protein [Gemmatales bacterium]